MHKTTAAVYQVTRLGHEHCDVTEGVLLDITPLVDNGKKFVTLYDKDLTEGVNLLIGKIDFSLIKLNIKIIVFLFCCGCQLTSRLRTMGCSVCSTESNS